MNKYPEGEVKWIRYKSESVSYAADLERGFRFGKTMSVGDGPSFALVPATKSQSKSGAK